MYQFIMRKQIPVILAFLIILQLTAGFGLPNRASAAAIDEAMNIITGVTMTDPVDKPIENGGIYEQGSQVTIDYTWALPNGHGFVAGDTFSFQIPDQFLLFNDISGDLKLSDDESVGTFQVTRADHKVVMTFNDYIETHDQVQGTIHLETQFDTKKITGSTTQTIVFPVNGGDKIYSIIFKPAVSSTIAKSGVPDGFNAKSISWTVDVNTKLEAVENAVVTDTIPSGLLLADPAAVEVYYLDVQLDGSVVQGALVDLDKYAASLNGNILTVSFTDSQITSAYRIKYVTAITDTGIASFTNKATFQGKDNKPSAEVTATVAVHYVKQLEKPKPVYHPDSQRITWTIKFNYKELAIQAADAVLTDLFNSSQQLIASSFNIYPVTLDAEGKETKGAALDPSAYTITDSSDAAHNGFILSFNQDVNSAYLIQYETESKERIEGSDKITNTVTWQSETASTFVDIYQVVLQKSVEAVDYVTQTVKWKIRLNADSQTMNDAVLTDTFTKGGLRLDPASLVLDPAVPYTLDGAVGNDQGFKLTFTDPLTVPVTISYTTAFNNDWLTDGWIDHGVKYPNYAELEWKVNADIHKVNVTRTFEPNGPAKSNGYKNGSYNAASKELTWTVGVNYNRKALTSAVINDTLRIGQTLIPGSVKLYEMNIAVDGAVSKGDLVDSSGYTVTNIGDQLDVAFLAPISKGYILEFRTSLSGVLIDEATLTNTAYLLDGNSPQSQPLTASVTIPNGGEYVDKTGAQDGDQVNWTVYVNRNQSTLNDAVITDTPSANQRLIPDSFHVYATTVAENGAITKGTELAKGTNYAVEIHNLADGSQTFTLSFLLNNKVIASAYILEYKTLIMAENGETLSNQVSLSGNNVQVVTKETTEEVVVGISGGSGTGSGVRGSLSVAKLDEKDNTKLLSGATFSLYRLLGADRILIGTLTTGADGKAVFTKLLMGNYELVETAAPAGYRLDSTVHPVTINSATAVEMNVTNKKKSTVTPPGPTDPTDPVDPTEPTDPNPTDPTNPPDPQVPVDPTVPVDPVDPTVPAGPTDPTDPAQPTDPTDPTNPTDEGEQPDPGPHNGDNGSDGDTGGDTGVPQGNNNSGNGAVLPKTGEGSHLPIKLIGAAFILAGLFLFRTRFYRSRQS